MARSKVGCQVEFFENRTALVKLESPVQGVAAGQSVVFYGEDEEVLGGGWVERRLSRGAVGEVDEAQESAVSLKPVKELELERRADRRQKREDAGK
jgi:hypothetical protein